MENKLGKYLKSLRKAHGYTQEFIASGLDISRQAYSHYETGRAVPTNDTCYKLAKIYEISLDDILAYQLASMEKTSANNEMNSFLAYLDDDKNVNKLKNLTRTEKELLFLFNSLPQIEQDEVLEILRIKKRKTSGNKKG